MESQATPLAGKTPAESYTEMVQIVYNAHANGSGRLFGGELMKWIDTVGAVTARRHCAREVTTAAVDTLRFEAPVPVNSTVLLKGKITFTGRTSMEVRVGAYVELLSGERCRVNEAFLVFVALDDEGIPTPVPPILPETESEKAAYEAGKQRQALRLQRRKERF
ncbi:MAG: acyl-CoA thioesterase [Oscillospiraceae bacterium]|jgi:acyl-CoA hydrolase|nr:acyl-CoA thioesterase [Oscillospiraceae bacterium]